MSERAVGGRRAGGGLRRGAGAVGISLARRARQAHHARRRQRRRQDHDAARRASARIAPWNGRVIFEGEDVTRLPAHAKAARGLVLVPEGRQLFSQHDGRRESGDGRVHQRAARKVMPSAWSGSSRCSRGLKERRQAEGRHVLGRRAADAGDRPRPDDRSGDSASSTSCHWAWRRSSVYQMFEALKALKDCRADQFFWSSRTCTWLSR